MKLKQDDRVRVTRDVYGKKVAIEATVVAVTNQYLVLEGPSGESFHCYKADAELIWRGCQEETGRSNPQSLLT